MESHSENYKVSVCVPAFVGRGLRSTIRVGIWYCHPGSPIRYGQRLVELAVGSMNVTVHAPCDGRLIECLCPEDTMIAADAILGVIRTYGHGSTSES
ncbi:MAG: Biotin-requiring enzyme [Planctomycetota bacterium]